MKLQENQGKELEIELKPIDLAIIIHLYEGKPPTEVLAGRFGVESKSMFFLGDRLLDLHRPVIDDVKLKHPKSGKILERIPEVLDNWLDSGSMPFAQDHYPFKNADDFFDNYPGDFIFEYIAQTRAWFYVLHVLGVALTGKFAFRNAATSGVIFGTDGRKMSKTYGNYPDPRQTIENYGAEAMRWYLLSSKLIVGEDINFDEKSLAAQLRQFLIPLWNINVYLTTYAELHDWQPTAELLNIEIKPERHVYSTKLGEEIDTYWYKIPFEHRSHKLDIALLAELQRLIRELRAEMDDYNIPKAARKLQDFVDYISKWYIRGSRDRFAQGDAEALETLYHVYLEVVKMAAPFVPFITEKIYQELVIEAGVGNQPESVHLCDYPEADMEFLENNDRILEQVDFIREIISMGQAIRTQNGLKLRQPLSELRVSLSENHARDFELEAWMKDLIASELNVKKVIEKADLSDEAAKESGWLKEQSSNYHIEIALNSVITELLAAEGLYRELARKIQALRKRQNFDPADQISLHIETDDSTKLKLLKFEPELAATVNANQIQFKRIDKQYQNQIVEIQANNHNFKLILIKVEQNLA